MRRAVIRSRALVAAVALLAALAAGEARATYPDLEAWAESPPAGWTLYCSETLDNSDTISGSSNNPSSSTTKQCPSGSSSGGTALTSNQSAWAMVTLATAGITTVGTGPTRVLRENQADDGTSNISVFPSSFTLDASTTSYRISFRHYRWFSSDAEALLQPKGSKSRKIDEINIGPTGTSGTASWSLTNQDQQADIANDAGSIDSFFSSPGTDCELGPLTRVEGSAVSILDCKVPYGCRFEKAITWDHVAGTMTFETLAVQLGASGEVKRDRRLESCTPSILPSPFKSDSNGAYVNMNAHLSPQSGNGDTFVSMVVGAYRLNDTTTNIWIGCSEEIEGVGCGDGDPEPPATPTYCCRRAGDVIPAFFAWLRERMFPHRDPVRLVSALP